MTTRAEPMRDMLMASIRGIRVLGPGPVSGSLSGTVAGGRTVLGNTDGTVGSGDGTVGSGVGGIAGTKPASKV